MALTGRLYQNGEEYEILVIDTLSFNPSSLVDLFLACRQEGLSNDMTVSLMNRLIVDGNPVKLDRKVAPHPDESFNKNQAELRQAETVEDDPITRKDLLEKMREVIEIDKDAPFRLLSTYDAKRLSDVDPNNFFDLMRDIEDFLAEAASNE